MLPQLHSDTLDNGPRRVIHGLHNPQSPTQAAQQDSDEEAVARKLLFFPTLRLRCSQPPQPRELAPSQHGISNTLMTWSCLPHVWRGSMWFTHRSSRALKFWFLSSLFIFQFSQERKQQGWPINMQDKNDTKCQGYVLRCLMAPGPGQAGVRLGLDLTLAHSAPYNSTHFPSKPERPI